MATQLGLYNRALGILKVSPLASVTENIEARRLLDASYTPTLEHMLEQGYWKFATRSVSITFDNTITPSFGYTMAFNKPDDWVQTYQVSGNEFFDPPLDDWIEESNLWFADITPIYVRFISDDGDYGGDLLRFTARYTEAVAYELARRVAPKLAASVNKKDLDEDAMKALSEARSFEALREPMRRPPAGHWVNARFGRGAPRRVPGGWQF